MRAAEALHSLQSLERPVIETGEAVSLLGITSANAGMLLRRLESAGHISWLGRGLWLLDKNVDPAVVVPYLTRPFPSYVSLSSALSRHGMIEQIPKQVFAVSADRHARTIETPFAVYSIHHIVPEVFGGYAGDDQTGFFATPEKALFDSIYLPSAQRTSAHLPELELPSHFDHEVLTYWTSRIKAPWLRGKVGQALDRIISNASVSVT
jgi:predicted transcriptional regulator of viral defense system